MISFFKRIVNFLNPYGSKKSYKTEEKSLVMRLVEDTLSGLIERGGFQWTFEVRSLSTESKKNISNREVYRKQEKREHKQYVIEISGEDEALLLEGDGKLLEALQLYLKRVVQHHHPADRSDIFIDSKGYQEKNQRNLIELAEEMKKEALAQGKAVYHEALSPKDRRVIHQHFVEDSHVKSKSIGDGVFKKIKVYPLHVQSTDKDKDIEKKNYRENRENRYRERDRRGGRNGSNGSRRGGGKTHS